MTGGIIVRLIDVVLILLFGFISISEVNRKSKIELPKSLHTPASYPDMESILIIGITNQGTYFVENESREIADFEDLKNYIIENNKRDLANETKTRVRIRSNWDAPIRFTIELANFCDEFEIAKGIDVIRKTKRDM